MSAINVAFTGSIPEKYDACLGPLLFEPYAILMRDRINQLPGNHILEIACGTGRVTRHLATLRPDIKMIATDLNAEMIKVAQKKVPEKNVEWQVVNAQELPFADESFDIVVCQFGYMFVPDKALAYKEAFRVLKKGGHFICSTWDKVENNDPARIAIDVINNFFKGNAPTFLQVPYSMYNPDEINDLLKEVGFTNISVETVKKEGLSESAKLAATGFIEGNPILVEINNINPDSVAMIEATLTNQLALQLGDEPLRCQLSAIVASGSK